MSDQQHCINCLREVLGSYHYPCPQCNWSPDQHGESGLYLSPGTILHNQYQIGKILGHGGFGITYLAWDNNLETKLAIKEYMPRDFATRNSTNAEVSTFAGDAKDNFAYGLDRFLDEARTLAKFQQHVGIVSVLNFFKANGTGYMVMEYVDGLTLKEYVADMGKLSWDRTLDLFMPVMDALREVHKHDMLHRDIAPDNIYLCRNNQIKLLDFGSARYALGGHSRSLSVVVKPGYAPEEQYRAKGKQGAWTDVYSVAASMYRCVTGVVPPEALDRMDEDELVKPSELGVQIPAVAENAMLAALAIKAENRIQSIEEFQQALWAKKVETPNNDTLTESVKPSTTSIEEAIVLFNLQDYEKAFVLFEYAAKRGDATAQNYLGFMFDNGHGVNQSHQQAAQWYQKAAVQGDARAQTNLGVSYLNGEGAIQDCQNAKLWFQKAADQGHAHAQYSLGAMYENGQGIYSQDAKQAAQWYQKAADQGHADAQFNLERLHQHPKDDELKIRTTYGKSILCLIAFFVITFFFFIQYFSKNTGQTESTPEPTIQTQSLSKTTDQQASVEEGIKFYNQGNYDKALIAFRPDADQGNAGAQNWLGVMYQNGQGVTKNDQQAVQWYRKAADQGNADAQYNLGLAFANGQGVTQDYQQAAQLFLQLADKGYSSAQYSLGWMYANGRGVTKDDQVAVQWYRKAADQGNADAQYNLGLTFANGQGVTKDDQQALLWIQKAADQGDADAQYSLGWMYQNGRGLQQSKYEAVIWFRKAAEHGSVDAKKILSQLEGEIQQEERASHERAKEALHKLRRE